jgi:D-lactate dehydrogenase
MRTDTCDVFFYEAFKEEEAALRAFLPDGLCAGFTADTIQEAGHAEPPAKLISLRTQSMIPAAWADNIDALLSRSTGYDHLTAFRNRTGTRAALGYLPLYCARAVAEHVALLMLALLRKLPRQTGQFDTFNRDGLTGSECEGKTLLIVGVGHIGSEIARIGQGLGMRVFGVDLEQKYDFVHYTAYDDMKAAADIIVCAMNLTPENSSYFNEARLSGIKPTALFINIARGELAPAGILVDRLKAGRLGGAGLDVYEGEKEVATALRSGMDRSNPALKQVMELNTLPNVICTPHNAFNTQEAVRRKSEQSLMQIENLRKTGRFIWPVPA